MSYQLSNGGDPGIVERLGALAGSGGGHRTLAEKAFEMLHGAIVSGALQPGERLPIEDLAGAMAMSPMPIREALRRLDAAGLVENVPHRGARVAELSVDDLRDVYDARLMLETSAISRAAVNFSDEDAQEATAALEALAQALAATDRPGALQAHTRFHFALYGAASSRWLIRLIIPLWDSAERYRVAHADASAANEALRARMDEHERLLEACKKGRSKLAGVELSNHLIRTANQVSNEMGGPQLYEAKKTPGASRSR